MSLYIGLMSGTSMDGIDAALVDMTTNRLIAGHTYAYREDVFSRIQWVLSQELLPVAELTQLSTLIGQEFARATLQLLAESGYTAKQITAIGSHGQTIAHGPEATPPYTIQLGCGHTIAELTGITTVADFRTRDVVLGGQGAPFAPLYHQALFAPLFPTVTVVNIGGIANITRIEEGEVSVGFDTGPGNCLMDAWIQQHVRSSYDKGGAWAASGRCCERLLARLLQDNYFNKQPPKSIGKEYFSLTWLNNHLNQNEKPEDVQATLLALTAKTISDQINTDRLLICGGGVHNRVLMETLQTFCPNTVVQSTADWQVDPDHIEAMMFAWLAEKTLKKEPVNLRKITGSKKMAYLGAIYPGG